MPCPLRSKRKELDDVAEDLSEFSLSEPAVKIRRLVADVPVSIDLQEVTSPAMFEEMDIGQEQSSAAVRNDELALVLYKPPTVPGLESGVPSSASFVVDSKFIASIKEKNQFLWSDHAIRKTENEAGREEEGVGSSGNVTRATDTCLAVVPWLPSSDNACRSNHPPFNEDQMDCVGEVETDAMPMDLEEDMGIAGEAAPSYAPIGMESPSGLQQWQQQHCMFPNTTNASATLSWL